MSAKRGRYDTKQWIALFMITLCALVFGACSGCDDSPPETDTGQPNADVGPTPDADAGAPDADMGPTQLVEISIDAPADADAVGPNPTATVSFDGSESGTEVDTIELRANSVMLASQEVGGEATGELDFESLDLERYLDTERLVQLEAVASAGGDVVGRSDIVRVVVEDRLALVGELADAGGPDFEMGGNRGETVFVSTSVDVDGADPVERALDFLDRYGPLWNLHDASQTAFLSRIERDEMGREHAFFSLQKEGIPVWGFSVVVHLDGNTVTGAAGDVFPTVPDLPDEMLSAGEVERRIEQQVPAGGVHAEPRLVYFDGRVFGWGRGYQGYAYRAGVTLREADKTPSMFADVVVDAASGEFVAFLPVSSAAKNFEVWDADSSPFAPWIACFEPAQGLEQALSALEDATEWVFGAANDIIEFFGGEGNLPNDVNLTEHFAEKVCDTGGCNGNAPPPAVDAQSFAHTTYDYYSAEFGRNGMDGAGGETESFVRVNRPDWDPFGEGNIYNGICNRMEFVDNSVPLDLYAHEHGHGITRHEVNPFLMPIGEPGILNEHISDAFAVIVESEDQFPNDDMGFDWLMTDVRDVQNPANPNGVDRNQPENAERYFTCDPTAMNPDADFCIQGSPLDDATVRQCIEDNWFFWDIGQCGLENVNTYLNTRDMGGIHWFAGIPNRAIALIGAGGEHEAWDAANRIPDEETVEIEVTGIGRDKLAALVYATVGNRVRARQLMQDYAFEMLAQARAFRDAGEHGFDDDDVCQVRNAFFGVGLIDQADAGCDGNLSGDTNDDDGDGTLNGADNCPLIPNISQADADTDGIGDVCDDDADGDGILEDDGRAGYEPCPTDDGSCDDNCVYVDDSSWNLEPWETNDISVAANANQEDANENGVGDSCEDPDRDGILADGDGDGQFGNATCTGGATNDCDDNCPDNWNPQQADRNSDGRGDACSDADDDGVNDSADTCPDICNPNQRDLDRDGIDDCSDDDDDGDGIDDEFDMCPNDPAIAIDSRNPSAAGDGTTGCITGEEDADGDGVPNCDELSNDLDPNDPDVDGDGIADGCDPCQLLSANDPVDQPGSADPRDYGVGCFVDQNLPTSHRDQDGDGIGNACDSDLDGDGEDNSTDECPTKNDHTGYVASRGASNQECVPLSDPSLPFGPEGLPAWVASGLSGPEAITEVDLTPCGMSMSGGAPAGANGTMCPDWLGVDYGMQATLQADVPIAAVIVNHRGEVVASAEIDEATQDPDTGRYETTVSFKPAADSFYRLGGEGGRAFRNTKYRLMTIPDVTAFSETESTIVDLSLEEGPDVP